MIETNSGTDFSYKVWYNPKPVYFEELSLDGWIKTDEFDWEGVEAPADLTEPGILRSNS
ncbi:MAG: hypothetical protein JRI56_04570 [Deltaproteobacteria bacterium]|nr:hypothetical protein [Deltaproteobacteria bacterium]